MNHRGLASASLKNRYHAGVDVHVGQESGRSIVQSLDGVLPGRILSNLLNFNLQSVLVDLHCTFELVVREKDHVEPRE